MQRWICRNCASSVTRHFSNDKAVFAVFCKWVLGEISKPYAAAKLGIDVRKFERITSWCWDIKVSFLKQASNKVLILDGTVSQHNALLFASTHTALVSRHWAERETSVSWNCFLSGLSQPDLVVCDGQKGLIRAVKQLWPRIPIQRCLFRIYGNIRVRLTQRPEGQAERELLELARQPLINIRTREAADTWIGKLAD